MIIIITRTARGGDIKSWDAERVSLYDGGEHAVAASHIILDTTW